MPQKWWIRCHFKVQVYGIPVANVLRDQNADIRNTLAGNRCNINQQRYEQCLQPYVNSISSTIPNLWKVCMYYYLSSAVQMIT